MYTDSQAVIKSLQKRLTQNEIIKDCHEILNSLGKTNKVTINWIPGHKGYEGNEIADKLAKAGSMKETNSDTYDRIPFNILTSYIKKHFNTTILNRYKNSGISSEAQIITNELLNKLNNSTKNLSNILLKLSITNLSIIVKVLSNHNSLNYHQTAIDKAYNEHCDYCTEVMKNCDPHWEINCKETAFHILYKCRFFTNIRSKFFNKNTIKHNQLFNKNITASLLQIAKFFNKSKVLTKIPKLAKRDLSPNRLINPNKRKRSKPITSTDGPIAHKRPKT